MEKQIYRKLEQKILSQKVYRRTCAECNEHLFITLSLLLRNSNVKGTCCFSRTYVIDILVFFDIVQLQVFHI